MRVLIILALVGAAFSELIATSPLGLSPVIVDSTKPSYEYGSSVQTPSYNNYAYVRSGEPLVRAPIVAAVEPKPTYIAARSDLPFYAPSFYPTNYIGTPFVRTAIPTSNLVYKSDFGAWPTTRLVPVPIGGERLLIKTAEPAVVPATVAATPTNIVHTVVEPKVVGSGLLERKSQYHSQNELGEAAYGHREPFQSHDAVQDAFGNKVGSFSYIGADGRLLQTDYVADANGYHVKSNALPVVATAVEAAKVRRRRSLPIEEIKEEANVDAKAPVEKRSLSLIAPSLVGPSLVRSWPLPLTRSWVAPSVFPQTVVHSPLAYSSYSYGAAPWYNAPIVRSPWSW